MGMDISKLFNANSVEIKKDVSELVNTLDYEQILLSISKTIINYRKRNNLTQKEFAKKLNVSQEMISKLEKGNLNVTFKTLHNISVRLENSPDLFIQILKNIITELYKNRNIEQKFEFKIFEKYKDNNDKRNITYLNYNDDGGMVYGKISCGSELAVNR